MTAGVITVAFRASAPDPIRMAIDEVANLGVSKVIVVHDIKGPSGQHALAAKDGAAAGIPLEILPVDESETTLRTRWGIQKAFEDPQVKAVLVFPGDIDPQYPPTEDNRRGWRQMVEMTQPNLMVVGDFRSAANSFKERFDRELIGLAAVEAMFPQEALKIRVKGLHKLRGEFYGLGREVYDQFRARQIAWTMDLTVDFVLTALGTEGLECRVADIGEFHDNDDGRRNPLGPMMQMVRFVSQLALQRIRMERNKPHADPLKPYDEIRASVGSAFERCLIAADRYRRFLGTEAGAEPLGVNDFGVNQKLELSYGWARFRGFSYLFDPPAEDLEPLAGALRICNRRGFNALYDGLDWLLAGEWGRMLAKQYLLCRLPYESFHVTLKDGFNEENLKLLHAEAEGEFRRFLDGLPTSLPTGCPNLPARDFPTGFGLDQALRFRYRELCLWGKSVLVARLKPADASTREVLRKVEEGRTEMSRQWASTYGLPAPDKPEKYVPHVSLGYFPNPDLAAPAESLVPLWSQAAAQRLEGATVEFRSASLYAFTDMASFFKAVVE